MIGLRKPQRSSTTLGSPWTFDQMSGSPVTSEGLASSSCRKMAQATTSAFISGIATLPRTDLLPPNMVLAVPGPCLPVRGNLSCQGTITMPDPGGGLGNLMGAPSAGVAASLSE